MTGRCFSLTCLPLRQQRRISNFSFAVVGDRQGGRAAGSCSAFNAEWTGRDPACTTMGTGCNAASIMRDSRRDGTPIQFPGDAARVAAFLPDRREPCGSVRHPTGGRCRIFIPLTKHDQLGGDLLREGAQRLPGVGLLHSLRMEKTNAESVAPAYVNPRG